MATKAKPNGKSKPNGKQPPTEAADGEPTLKTTIDYDEAVREAKEILGREDADQMRLGQLADEVKTQYGEDKLGQFAKEIGIASCTLKRRRTVYRQRKEIGALAPISYSVLQELGAHPDRTQLLRDKPQMTKAEARKTMQAYKRSQKASDGWERDELDKWLRNVLQTAIDARGAETKPLYVVANSDRLRTLQELVELVDPKSVPRLRAGGNALLSIADTLEKLDERIAAAEQDEAERKEAVERRATEQEGAPEAAVAV